MHNITSNVLKQWCSSNNNLSLFTSIADGTFDCLSDIGTAGLPYSDLYEPDEFGSAGGGPSGGRGGGRIWFNVTGTTHIDGLVSANGEAGTSGDELVSGGGSGGSIWMHCNRITGYGLIHAQGGDGSRNGNSSAGGGAGGRIALYFQVNHTYSEFRYLANGGQPGIPDIGCEPGGPGTVFLYYVHHEHRTLIIDNNGAAHPRTKYVNYDDISQNGATAWILPMSGVHDFAGGSNSFHFEELQIYGNGHVAILPPPETFDGTQYVIHPQFSTDVIYSSHPYNVTLFFKYMIGDRTGSVHIADEQELDLERPEIDLPFNVYVYSGGHLGLAPDTIIHGVEIHLSGMLSHIVNLTLHHGGYIWLKHGGHTTHEPDSHYWFKNVRIQDDSSVNGTTDPIHQPGITFYTHALYVEGGGTLHGTHLTMISQNITVDDGGKISADGLGYHHVHREDTHGHISIHGDVNPGIPDDVTAIGAGAGHGGSGGRSYVPDTGAGFAYGDLYEPYVFGSAGGPGPNNAPGGTGGGLIWMNVTGFIHIDGEVTANGGHADELGGGGGSGGSILMYCNLIKGYGKIAANGGPGSTNVTSPGGGGGGGRIAMYFWNNETMTGFNYHTIGGASGDENRAENGGGGTAFLYHMIEEHRTLIIDNGGLQPRDRYHIIDTYHDLSKDGCRTWILPDSGKHPFASNLHVYDYNFEELQIYGAAHIAILTDPVDAHANLFFLYMIGDRSGTVHLGNNQVMDLHRPEIDLPFSVRAYAGSYLGLAPTTIIHDVSVWMHGELDHIRFMTLHHNGLLSMEHGGHTSGNQSNHYSFVWVRVQDNATIAGITDPVTEAGINFFVDDLFVEGGGNFCGTSLIFNAINITVDDGGSVHADGLGYRLTDVLDINNRINVGLGATALAGSSGAGHGGSSGHGAGTANTGQPYGHLFEPSAFGSAGGGGPEVGGNGAGTIWFNVTGQIQIDGEVRANGNGAQDVHGGGGSGGSIWMHCNVITGMGKIRANGGSSWLEIGGTGGGGAGGRVALYFWDNTTYLGTFESHGGEASTQEPGGPGTVFIYHEHHQHSTLYINNNLRESNMVTQVADYTDLSTDSFKAWFLPVSGDHWLAQSNHDYRFDELQIYGNAQLAILPEPFDEGASLFFKHMIGDRTGVIHIGNHQVMDLRRFMIDTPFSSYVYPGGYLGLGHYTILDRVFVNLEGTLDHVTNLTIGNSGELRLYLTGSTNERPRLNYHVNGTTIIKARGTITAISPFAHLEQFNVVLNHVTVEGGGRIQGKNIYIQANSLTVDDGGHIDVSDGGYITDQGKGQ